MLWLRWGNGESRIELDWRKGRDRGERRCALDAFMVYGVYARSLGI